ncbi:MAG: SH3 domain-containing protein [Gemmatimonadaceae bacterium]
MRFRTVLCATILAAAAATPAVPQGLTGPAVLYARPGDTGLATVAEGTVLDRGATSGEYTRVTLHGFIASSLLGGARDSFPVSVGATEVRLRGQPSAAAPVVANLREGMAFHVVKRSGGWTEVKRSGWIRRSAFPAVLAARQVAAISRPSRPERTAPKPRATAAGTSLAPAAGAPVGPPPRDTTPANAEAVTPDSTAPLSTAPGLAPVASVMHGAVLTAIGRERGWVRVRLEGWMREQDLEAADSSLAGLSAADLRSNPDGYVGRTVRWSVTALAFQTADPLHRDMRPDEPYLLARGPGKENALLYLALPPGLVDRAKGLAPMTLLVITARVRTGSSSPAGVPILDVITLAAK